MAENWLADVQKYDSAANPDIVAGIVRHCGIALRKRDSSLVSFTSPDELGRVRESFLKKKLGLTSSDSDLDEAIGQVGQTMKADRTKNRVTVYYLLAHRFDRLHLFVKAGSAAAATTGAASIPAASAAEPAPVAGSVPGEPRQPSIPVGRPEPVRVVDELESGGFNWWPWLLAVLAVILLVVILRSCGASRS